MVGHGAAIDPPHRVLDAVAPVSGTLLRLMPHAYVIMTADGVGILVHLGLDTVSLNGAGFTALVSQGDQVSAGQPVITYDVPAIVAAGLSPVVPVVVMDEREASNITVGDAVSSGAEISPGALLFTAGK
jgi:PTS system glucose-specific IIA component